jgi:hypothetical protein
MKQLLSHIKSGLVPQYAPRNPLALSLSVPVPRLFSRVSGIIQMRKRLEPKTPAQLHSGAVLGLRFGCQENDP